MTTEIEKTDVILIEKGRKFDGIRMCFAVKGHSKAFLLWKGSDGRLLIKMDLLAIERDKDKDTEWSFDNFESVWEFMMEQMSEQIEVQGVKGSLEIEKTPETFEEIARNVYKGGKSSLLKYKYKITVENPLFD